MTDDNPQHGGEGILVALAVGLAAGAAYRWIFTRRWHRGATMGGPALLLAGVLP